MRTCTKCNKEKPVSSFGNDYKAYDRSLEGRIKKRVICKDCTNAVQRERTIRIRATDQFSVGGHIRSRRKLWENYHLTPEQYIEMYESQEGVCVICEFSEAVVVDHNHDTGAVRALLCQHCNVMIGAAKENVTTLARGIEYLSRDVGA